MDLEYNKFRIQWTYGAIYLTTTNLEKMKSKNILKFQHFISKYNFAWEFF